MVTKPGGGLELWDGESTLFVKINWDSTCIYKYVTVSGRMFCFFPLLLVLARYKCNAWIPQA